MDRNELMDNIIKYSFFALDLNLYLDNFPENEDACKDFKEISTRLRGLINKYEKTYGPLINFGFAYQVNQKAWTDEPWPWESEK